MRKNIAAQTGWRWGVMALLLAVVPLGGCEIDSFFDPSVVGRWEQTPVTLPILTRLDVIDEPPATNMEVTSVRPEDLVPDRQEYIIGSGDLLTISVFELMAPGQESVQTRRVDETGDVRMPVIGSVRAVGRSPSELETAIQQRLAEQDILRDAMVSVILQEARQNTFTVIGEPRTGGTAIGTYTIPKPDFRVLDAVAMARGVPARTKSLLIYRQTPLTEEVAGDLPEEEADGEQRAEPPEAPAELIEQMMQQRQQEQDGDDADAEDGDDARPAEPPTGVEAGLENGEGEGRWVNVDGEWVRVERGEETEEEAAARAAQEQRGRDGQPGLELSDLMTQRIIEIPYDRLLNGNMGYNIVIRPGDIIRVPGQAAGFVYVMGHINRPGAYTVPGENELTLMRVVASAGNLSQLAIPERVDLTREVGNNMQATVRVNLRAIFEGTEPDIYLKPNDLINVGTNWPATPLAILRNGFRATYGFGFVLDRNFENDVFGD
ncbi:MAG: polysaccharide biosynthesis/export family protein [Phycisphaeraceae bacterium]